MNGSGHRDRETGSSGRHVSSRDGRDPRDGRDDRRDRERRGGGSGGGGGGRRRSRTPEHRDRRPGREMDVDQYSSSRTHREREREDRYRDRRDDREWDRDRGPRRGGTRDGDDRHARRDPRPERGGRDLFDDRRGPRRAAIDEVPRQRERSASPPRKKKEPTPDLTDIISVLARKRRLTQWDIKPPGYENVTAEQAKLSGMYPLPGAPRQHTVDPRQAAAFMSQNASSANNEALKPSTARQSKRIFLKNIPSKATKDSITDFFNLQLNGLNTVTSTDPCSSTQLAGDNSFAMLEFKAPEDATLALVVMDGVTMMAEDDMVEDDPNRAGFSTMRPSDYIVPSAATEAADEPMDGELPSVVPDGPNKMAISNVGEQLDGPNLTELLATIGPLKSFVLVKDLDDYHRGAAFFEYADPAHVADAIDALNGMELVGKALKVRKACEGVTQASGFESSTQSMAMFAAAATSDVTSDSRVIQLLNMVTSDELMDQQDYEEIFEEIQEECAKFGAIEEMKMPRPGGPARQTSGVGKIFIKYADTDSAKKAMKALAGRKFSERTVVATFFGERYFDIEAW